MSVLLLDSLARHLIQNCKLLREPPWILECVNSLEVCFSCHAAHVSTSPTLLHGSRDLSRAWCECARKEIRHIHGFVAYSAAWSLIMKSAGDDWEELRLVHKNRRARTQPEQSH